MGMTGFSDAEMALLSGLDAVAWVTRTRITYTDSFKREAVTRYRRGESPVRIFREAGLDPRIIGNKRIERCIARWKREPPDAGTTRPHACVCSIESGPCERVDVFHVSGRFWSTSACGEKRTPARPAWTSFPS